MAPTVTRFHDHLVQLARVPRPITPALEPMVHHRHPVAVAGSWALLLGFLGGLVVVVSAFFGMVPWLTVAAPASLVTLGSVLRAAVRDSARRKGREALAEAPLVVGAVVQANHGLYDPKTASYGPGIVVFARDPRCALDLRWIRGIADQLLTLKHASTGNPRLDALGSKLRDEQSFFDRERLPPELVGNVETYWSVMFLNPEELPGRCVPEDRLLPLILRGEEISVVPPTAWSVVPPDVDPSPRVSPAA